jgi:hypothetical protein
LGEKSLNVKASNAAVSEELFSVFTGYFGIFTGFFEAPVTGSGKKPLK